MTGRTEAVHQVHVSLHTSRHASHSPISVWDAITEMPVARIPIGNESLNGEVPPLIPNLLDAAGPVDSGRREGPADLSQTLIGLRFSLTSGRPTRQDSRSSPTRPMLRDNGLKADPLADTPRGQSLNQSRMTRYAEYLTPRRRTLTRSRRGRDVAIVNRLATGTENVRTLPQTFLS